LLDAIATGPAAGRALVNLKYPRIFNGVFGVQESAQNGQNSTKKRVFETRVFAFTMSSLTIIGAYAKRTNY
jgi:hypothetical protein